MTFSNIQKRCYYLRGEFDYTTASDDLTTIKDHANAAVQDVVNMYPFSWNRKTEDLTLSSGTATIANTANDYNSKWHLADARIANASAEGNDVIFHEIPLERRDDVNILENVYWLTYNTTTSRYIFNTLTDSGTVTIYYYFFPADMSSGSDICIVPDGEAVALLAAAKMYRGDERNLKLKQDYENEGMARIKELYTADQNYGPLEGSGTPTDLMSSLREG
jgi:hypothetical protein